MVMDGLTDSHDQQISQQFESNQLASWSLYMILELVMDETGTDSPLNSEIVILVSLNWGESVQFSWSVGDTVLGLGKSPFSQIKS